MKLLSETEKLFEELSNQATCERNMSSSTETAIQRCIRLKQEIPDYLLPGRFISKLTMDKRHLLQKLTSIMTFYRQW